MRAPPLRRSATSSSDDVVDLDHLFGQFAGPGAARQQRVVEQNDHVVDVGDGAVALGRVADLFGAQPQPRRIGSHIVGDPAQHHHARAQEFSEPVLQTIERIDQRPDFRRAAFGFRQGYRIKRQIDAVDRLGEARQRLGLAVHDKEREQGNHRAEKAGAKSDRQTQRTHQNSVADFDDQRFSGRKTDAYVDGRRNEAREQLPVLARIREIDADRAATERLQRLLDRTRVEAWQDPRRGRSDRRGAIDARRKRFGTGRAKHQRPLRAGRAFDQFDDSGDMVRNGQGIVFGRMGARNVIQCDGADPGHAEPDHDDQCDPCCERHAQDHVSGLTWAVNR